MCRPVFPAHPTVDAAPSKAAPPGEAAPIPAWTLPAVEVKAVALATNDIYSTLRLLYEVGGVNGVLHRVAACTERRRLSCCYASEAERRSACQNNQKFSHSVFSWLIHCTDKPATLAVVPESVSGRDHRPLAFIIPCASITIVTQRIQNDDVSTASISSGARQPWRGHGGERYDLVKALMTGIDC
jgi:hypothetical protein